MPETKKITYTGASTALNLYATIIRMADGYYLDVTDKTFKSPLALEANAALPLTEKVVIPAGTKTQVYEWTDATTVWDDGYYLIHIYERAGAAPVFNTDVILATATLKSCRDQLVERSYSYGTGG